MITSILIIIYICVTVAVAATLFVGGATGDLQDYVREKQDNPANIFISCIFVVFFWPLIAIYFIYVHFRSKK